MRVASRGVHRAAHSLTHEEQRPGAAVKRRLSGPLAAMTRHQAAAATLAPALGHCLKAVRRPWPGLFHRYGLAEPPRTNTALEQGFGAPRYHQRRAPAPERASA